MFLKSHRVEVILDLGTSSQCTDFKAYVNNLRIKDTKYFLIDLSYFFQPFHI